MKLPKKATILDASMIASAMRQANPLCVDASAVESIDTSVLQLLCAWTTARIDRPSAAFVDAVERCGLEQFLLHDRKEVA